MFFRPQAGLAVIILLILVQGCGPADEAEGATGPCSADQPCAKGMVCFDATCLTEDGDPDWDGLATAVEIASGTSPFSWDTDHDGVNDGEEFGEGVQASDTDFDGIPDSLESVSADHDGDCIPDQWDPSDGALAGDDSAAIWQLCRPNGFCADNWETLTIICVERKPVCADAFGIPIPLTEQSCNGVDDDCDGSTDEGLTLAGKTLGQDCLVAGICGQGKVECSGNGGLQCSSGPGGSSDYSTGEKCNGQDDDCDGYTDEDFLLGVLGPGKACQPPGICGPGTVECTADGLAVVCSTGPGGSAWQERHETCNGQDDDCDGTTDEDLWELPGLTCPDLGVCAKSPDRVVSSCVLGQWRCVGKPDSSYEDGFERSCDGLDNDCDGQVDEEFFFVDFDKFKKKVGESCGTGACFGGKVVCAPTSDSARCTTAQLATPEACDLLDNDCDGLVDDGMQYNGWNPGETCDGVGSCGTGTVECGPQKVALCSTEPGGSQSQAVAESCDGQDNDCDGTVDNDPAEPLGICPDEGICSGQAADAVSCVKGQWVCANTTLPGFEGQELTCDGLDNDCDGWVDDRLEKRFASVHTLWEEPPVGISNAAVFQSGTQLYLAGGQTPELDNGLKYRVRDQLLRWDPDAADYVVMAQDPAFARTGAALTSLTGGSLYLVGGRSQDFWTMPGPVEILPDGRVISRTDGFDLNYFRRTDHAVMVDSVGRIWLMGGRWMDGSLAQSVLLDPKIKKARLLVNLYLGKGRPTMLSCSPGVFHVLSCVKDYCQFVRGTESYPDKWSPIALPKGVSEDSTLFCFNGQPGVTVFNSAAASEDGVVQVLDNSGWRSMGPVPNLRRPLVYVGNEPTIVAGLGAQGEFLRPMRDDYGWYFLPPARFGAAFGRMGLSRGCFYGGLHAGAQGLVALHDFCCVDEGLSWFCRKPDNAPDSLFSVLVYDSTSKEFLLLGGTQVDPWDPVSSHHPKALFRRLDQLGAAFSEDLPCPETQPSPCGLSGAAGVVREEDGRLWIHGGYGEYGLNDKLWSMSLDQGLWQAFSPGIAGRFGHRMVTFGMAGEFLLLVGGGNSQGQMAVVQAETGSLSQSASYPWTEQPFGLLLFDREDGTLLYITPEGMGTFRGLEALDSTQLAGDVEAGFPAAGVTFFFPMTRRGVLFGGIYPEGTLSGMLRVVEKACP
jgi:hypothetical protein